MDRTTDGAVPSTSAAALASLGLDSSTAVGLTETAEAEFMLALHDGAPAEAKAALGMRSERVAGGVAVVMAGDPTGGYWNKALGFGVTESVTEDLVTHLVHLYAAAGAPALCLQVATAAAPAVDVRGRRGRRPRIHRPRRLGRRRARRGREPARRRARGGVLRCRALPEARGRGAQSAFLRVRVEAARAAGCSWMSAETWQEFEGAHNPSLHNLLRSGFVEVYDRRNWVWRPKA